MPAPRFPPGVKRTSWGRTARRRNAGEQRRAWRQRNRMVSVPRNKLAFPTSMRTTLRFCQNELFNITSGGSAVGRTFRANSVFDPVKSLGGAQPRGFNEYMGIYKTFTVTASKIAVNFMYQGYTAPAVVAGGALLQRSEAAEGNVPAQSPVILGIQKSVGDFVVGLPKVQCESDRTNWKVMTPQEGAKVVSTKMHIRDFFGKDALVGAEGYTGFDATSPASGDPDNQVFYHVWVGSGNSGYTAPGGVTYVEALITIEYDVTFTEPKALPQS